MSLSEHCQIENHPMKRTAAKRNFTDPYIAKLDTKGAPYLVYDAKVPGLAVRVTPGRKTFVLTAVYPGSAQAARRALGRWLGTNAAERAIAETDWERLPVRERPSFDAFLLERFGATDVRTAQEKAR